MADRRDKTTGLPLPSPVVPATNICLNITIPNAPEYKQALRGVISDLGKYWTWQQTVGESNENAQTAAELWRKAATTMVYSDECGGDDMSCDDVADCIENDAGTQAALAAIVSSQTTPGTTATPGQPMTPGQYNANLTPTDNCDPDVFWAQCSQLVDYTISAGKDILEKIEIYTNALEAAQFIEMVPILGTIIDEVQIDQFLEFADWTIEVATEIFDAADTQINREAIMCAIFCAQKDSCEITIQRLWEIENERLGGILDPASITTVEGLLSTMIALGTNPALPLDVWFTFVIAMAKIAGYFGIKGIDQSLNLILKLAENDANNDWELLCEDCPDDPGVGSWRIFTEYNSALNLGVIEEQTATYIRVAASANGDGLYRIVLKRNIGCTTVSGVSTTPAASYSAQGCDGWIDGPLGNGNYLNQYYGQSPVPFTVEFNTPA
jgi:hypothetical protein